jgi:ubiquinone/menaquinone biosynthesis C-methylase UbiE
MALYADVILPRLCHLAMRNKRLLPYRQRVVSAAEGRVLEIGIGSGPNLQLYGPQVSHVIGLEPSRTLIGMAERAARGSPVGIDLIEGSAERIPLDDRSIDSAVMTWVGCSIPDVLAALHEVRRVLRPGGRLLFVEHGLAPDAGVARWQDRLTPIWRRFSGGCHLNRRIDAMLSDGGFRIDRLDAGYAPGPRIMAYFYEGSATPR